MRGRTGHLRTPPSACPQSSVSLRAGYVICTIYVSVNIRLAAAPNFQYIETCSGPLSKDRPAHDAGHVPMTDLVNAGPPCRLIAKHLIPPFAEHCTKSRHGP